MAFNNLDLFQINENESLLRFKIFHYLRFKQCILLNRYFFLRISRYLWFFLVDTEDESRASITDKTPLIRDDVTRRASKFEEVSNHIGLPTVSWTSSK